MSFVSGGGKFESALLHVRDEKTSGTNGGASSAGNNTRVLNTIKTNEISGASLSSNTITLPSGSYFIMASAPNNYAGLTKLRLRNTTDSSYTLEGMSGFVDDSTSVQTTQFLSGRFTISAQKDFQIYHYINVAYSPLGFGRPISQGTEVYTDVMIWKVA